MNENMRDIPRPEYPRPQLKRNKWLNLNGKWEFEIDHGKSGRARKLYEAENLNNEILVPFCPESKLSGIEYKDFMDAIWYRKEFVVPEDWLAEKKILIHFGAVDYDTEVWINGKSAGTHQGGYTPFSFNISDLLNKGKNTVVVCAEDDVRSGLQPGGKQSGKYNSFGCYYTRTTGIWQTVWLECVPQQYIENIKYIPDIENECIHIEAVLGGEVEVVDEYTLKVKSFYDGKETGTNSVTVSGQNARLTLELDKIHLWEPGEGRLYDLELFLYKNDQPDAPVDKVDSYFGLRSVTLSDKAILINGKPVFQRLVLDQGFYPDGIYTAPTDNNLKKDIEISMELGFNGARLHEKIFEPRFLYWADRMGYIVWGEHGNWGLDITSPMGLERFLPEWMEALERDFNHPAIVGWCPFNETWDKDGHTDGTKQDNEVLRIVYNVTKKLDKTRPVIDTSGNFHVVTDIFDVHNYEQDPEKFAALFEPMKTGGEVYVHFPERQTYEGQPYFVSEYGGIWWKPGDEDGWGYGERPESEKEFIERYRGLTEALLNHPEICAFCYTQLYDIEQEVNGLYTYDREPKFDPTIFKEINIQRAAIEII